MRFTTTLRLLPLLSCLAAAPTNASEPVEIKVYATLRRSIDGVTDLHRPAYFALCDKGHAFDRRAKTKERFDYLVDELDIEFGRSLGPVSGVVKYSKAVREDSERPGHADLAFLEQELTRLLKQPSKRFVKKSGPRLDIAAHGAHGGYPEFMGEWTTPQAERDSKPSHTHKLPDNAEAAAELAAAIMQYNYTDFDRPRYFEPINEPHWSFTGSQELADWHLKTQAAIAEAGVDVLVGGPCNSVGYFYKRQFGSFNGVRDFIDNTRCELDFYSFHVYDYFKWNGSDIVGRVTSGLPLEGVLDYVQAYTVKKHGKQIDIVVSEQGGYMSGARGITVAELGELMAEQHAWEEEGFELEMRKRSIASHMLVSAAIGNTLTFMEHPHTVRKAVPFISLESMSWDPTYYSTLFTPYEYTDKNRWIESRNADYFRFFRGLQGERVVIRGGDPDLQVRAFADGKHLRIVLNNTSDVEHQARLVLPPTSDLMVRRYGRNDDFTPSYSEAPTDSVETLAIDGREAVMVVAAYDRPIPARGLVEETPYYARSVAVASKEGKPVRFTVAIPEENGEAAYATLRVAVSRPGEADPNVRLRLNGKQLTVPLEDAAPRLTDADEYASTKIVSIDPKMLRSKNRVEVAFADGGEGTIGSVVMRVGKKVPAERAASRTATAR